MNKSLLSLICLCALGLTHAQTPVSVGAGSYASFVPLSESHTSSREGSQAYQMEHRRLYLPDSLLARLGSADGVQPGTLVLPSNSWWTYSLINPWSGKLWSYPGWVEIKNNLVSVGYPTYWEPTGCEMKWDMPLTIAFEGLTSTECLVDGWGDYHVSMILQQQDAWVRVTALHGCPITWIEVEGLMPIVTNPDPAKYEVHTTLQGTRTIIAVVLLTSGLTEEYIMPYIASVPRSSKVTYAYDQDQALLTTTFTTDVSVLQGFLPHHYYNTLANPLTSATLNATYATPRGQLRLTTGNVFTVSYPVHSMLPFFPAPPEDLEGYDPAKMRAMCLQYAQQGSFGADTYWGGKGLTQMMHYMTAALQLGDTAVYRQAKQRLKDQFINWFTYTPGESQYFFARYNRWGALVGFDPSYDSDTFNDHHFHYGYFVYAAAVLCMLDEDFKTNYGPMIREVARDYANWLPLNTPGYANEPTFRTFDMYCGHSFAGGMGNEGNGNGQESSSEAMQSWGGLWMLGAALNDPEMLSAGVFGYTLEARGTAEYWFDRGRRNIDYTKYTHPYCCNLTMQGVGWWTWFSGDPVWMHSIQWLPISPVLQNYLSEDLTFTEWDYTEMYTHKEVGNYEALTGGLGDESGLGNVCLSYLALFNPDSAARVWNRADQAGKALTRNADTGGITYWLTHGLRAYGNIAHAIRADYPLASAYILGQDTTYAVFNTSSVTRPVHFTSGTTVEAAPNTLTIYHSGETKVVGLIEDEAPQTPDPIAAAWTHTWPNIALHKPVAVSSYENAGTLPVSATDGDTHTRWGSTHHDNEWIVVDLQGEYYIHYLTLRWEAAYASSYEIAVSSDSINWQTRILSGAGGVENIDLALRGRYIRLIGLSRATAYGISLYEFEAYGLPLNGDPEQVIALEVVSQTISLTEGETPEYTIQGYNYEGTALPISPTLSTIVTETHYTLTATYNGLQTTYTWPILETIHADTVLVSPAEVQVPLGDKITLTVSALDQFGYDLASYEQDYYALQLVDTTLWFANPLTGAPNVAAAQIHTVAYSTFNLATGKPATCSGTENENAMGADKAVDGQMNTRWSSRFMDNEWIEVDLLDEYLLDSVVIYWEAAYATQYEILFSLDGIDYTMVQAVSGNQGGRVCHTLPVDAAARFVRIVCKARNTGYGSSIYEFEVYGSGRVHPLTPPDPTALEEITQFGDYTNLPSEKSRGEASKFLHNGHLYILRGNQLFNSLGKRL